MPLTALTVVVPLSVPVPLPIDATTGPLNDTTVAPALSVTFSTGCVPRTTPVTVPTGCVVRTMVFGGAMGNRFSVTVMFCGLLVEPVAVTGIVAV